MKYVILAVLCLATSAFATIGYDAGTKTLTYGAASDLSTVVDPAGGQELTNPAVMAGNLTKDAFNALPGLQVIGFNGGPDARQGTTSINATYDASHVLTLNDFGCLAGYNYTGGWSDNRSSFSGAHVYDQFGCLEATGTDLTKYHIQTGGAIALNWFAANLSVNQANAGVSALGFVVDGRDTGGNYTDVGKIWITLSDASIVSFPYAKFGGPPASGDPTGIGFFYQAPAGLFVSRIECTRDFKAGNSFVAMDDLGFVIGGGSAPLYIHAHPGDVNNDGACNVVDLGVLAKYYDQTGLATSVVDPYGAGSWTKADFNNDGIVNVVDLGVLAKNYDWVGVPAVPTPEPMTLSLLGLAAAALIRRKK